MNQLPWPLPPTMSNRKLKPLLSTKELDVPLEFLAETELKIHSEKIENLPAKNSGL